MHIVRHQCSFHMQADCYSLSCTPCYTQEHSDRLDSSGNNHEDNRLLEVSDIVVMSLDEVLSCPPVSNDSYVLLWFAS